jgi:hypothetical protein
MPSPVALLTLVAQASQRPTGKTRLVPPMRGVVRGGEQADGERSVMPHCNAEGAKAGGTPPLAEELTEALRAQACAESPTGQ